jgi:hypothetical protein
VAVVVFVFLGRFRMTLFPLVAVPVSIIGTFAVMLLIGYSAKRSPCWRSCWQSTTRQPSHSSKPRKRSTSGGSKLAVSLDF